jgi:hypothetical protein
MRGCGASVRVAPLASYLFVESTARFLVEDGRRHQQAGLHATFAGIRVLHGLTT